MASQRKPTAVLISGRGSNMAALIEAAKAPDYPAEIVLVISNRPEAPGLARAAAGGVPTKVVDHRPFGEDRPSFERAIEAELSAHGVELICLAGFMRRLTPWLIGRWQGRVLNIHPALLPQFKGLRTHQRALAAGVKLHGASVHFVTEGVDDGPVIAQSAVPVLPGDTSERLAARVLDVEGPLYVAALRFVASGEAWLEGGETMFGQARTLPLATDRAFREAAIGCLLTLGLAFVRSRALLTRAAEVAHCGRAFIAQGTMLSSSLFDLTGEVALVTGASSGLGRRFARVLAANGARVVAVARRKQRLDTLVAEIEGAGGQALAIEADIADRARVGRAFDLGEEAFGRVTILINNAGVAAPSSFLGMKEESWRATLDVNLDAVVFTAQEAARRMVAKGGGAIVNIASVLSFGVQKGNLAYAVSKAAVMQATRAMALELAPKGVRVNAIAPGYFATEINADYLASPQGQAMMRAMPMGRFGEEGELDGTLLLLASRAGSFITGATIVVDGGHMLAIAER